MTDVQHASYRYGVLVYLVLVGLALIASALLLVAYLDDDDGDATRLQLDVPEDVNEPPAD